MERSFYLDMAARGLRFPIATHLVLHEQPDPEAILVDGRRLGAVMLETARRFGLPLALPLMDLTIEKDVMLRTMGVPADRAAAYHFDGMPEAARLDALDVLAFPRVKANCDAIAAVAAAGGVVPVGMSIGPFSLMTKLLADPITPLYLAGTGTGADDDGEVKLLYAALALGERVIAANIAAQLDAGAKAVFVCEPAANTVFFSPNQLGAGSTVFDDFVIAPNLRIKRQLDAAGADLLFHDCGELTAGMIRSFAVLDPAILSLGSPVDLRDAAPLVPKTTVITGNLPSKKFYSDADVPLDGVPALVRAIDASLAPLDHPYLAGSECDILSVPGYERTIMAKVVAFTGTAR